MGIKKLNGHIFFKLAHVNSDILTPPTLTLNTFGTMQPVIKAILFKIGSQQFLYGFPFEATISIHARVQEFSSGRVDSRCICHKKSFFCPQLIL